MNKHKLHHIYKKIKPISYWYFLVAFVISASITALALRDNNLTAVKLHNQLTLVDEQNGDVTGALNNLRSYIYSHMNTNLASGPNAIYPPIQLEYTYQRLVAAQQDQNANKSTANSQLYTQAEYYCQNLIPNGFSGRYRISCIENYVTSHSTTSSPSATIPTALYEFDFESPFWSPDFAGWSLVVSIILFIMFVVRFVLEKWLNFRLREHT